MNTNETKVDVLAVMDRIEDEKLRDFEVESAGQIRQARAAVAELIEAATLVCDLSSEEWQQRDGTRMAAVGNDGRRFVFVGPDLINGLIAAIARIGGAK